MSDSNFATNEEMIQFLPPEDMEPIVEVGMLAKGVNWGIHAFGVPDAHKLSQGDGITIAVLDSGYDPHDDLAPNFVDEYDFTGLGPRDQQGHGTHVMGIIAGTGLNDGVVGVAPKSKIISIKVLDSNGIGSYAWLESGIRKAIDLKVDLMNISIGSTKVPPPSVYQAIKDAADAGIIMCAAAGNDAKAVNYPARFDELIAVAAIDKKGDLWRRSSRGPQIDVVGPGSDIFSTYLGNGYGVLSGTSQASPFICGVCALVLSYTRSNPHLSQVKNVVDMLKYLEKISDHRGWSGGIPGAFGFGVPNFANVDVKNE